MVSSKRFAVCLFVPALMALALMALALMATGCEKIQSQFREDPAEMAKKRVSFILQSIKDAGEGTGTALQTAICRWEEDEGVISDRDALSAASDAFDAWRQQANIYPTLAAFEIGPKVEGPAASDPPDTYYVQAKIDGTWHWLRVPPKDRISWADS
jgi:hypothetical protein